MDNKAIFVKTRKGEDEMHGKISHLSDDLKRALLMVDGSSTFSEISKRAAPSMRATLGDMYEELVKTGFIQDKDMVGKTPKIAVAPKMSVPGNMVTPRKQQPVDEGAGELDFMSDFAPPPSGRPKARPDRSEKEKAESEEISRKQIEAEKIKARKEAEAIRLKAEQDAAMIREETARRARQEAEANRLKAEQEARKLREELNAPTLNTGKDATQLLEEAIRGQQQEAEAKRMGLEQQPKTSREVNETAKEKPELDTQQRLQAAIVEQQLAAEAVRVLTEKQARKKHDELETARLKIEQEAKLRLEAAARERERAEAARIKAEQEAAQILLEMEIAKQKAEQEAKARLEAEAKARLEAEAKALARIKAEEEAKAAELLARQEREAMAREAAARAAEAREAAVRATQAIKDIPADGADKPLPSSVTTSRSISATVLFFDVVGYTKQPVSKQIEIKRKFNQIVTRCLADDGGEHIILDTGDGAAIGFLQHPEVALEVAIKFRKTVMANSHQDYPDMKVRIGIHFGPINIEKDMNGRSNMVGDGINDAQRVMSFAGVDRILISRPYYDYVSRLNDEYADMFWYRGMQQDKHGREHPIYELVDTTATGAGAALSQANELGGEIQPNLFSFDSFQIDQPEFADDASAEKKPANKDSSATAATSASKQNAFVIDLLKVDELQPKVESNRNQQPVQKASLSGDTAQANQPADVRQPAKQQVTPPAESRQGNEQRSREVQDIAAEAEVRELADAIAKADAQTRETADAETKVLAEAQQRELETPKANKARATLLDDFSVPEPSRVERPVRVERVRRKPFAWGKLVGFVFKLGVFLLILLAAALFIIPYTLPMRDYMPKVQQLLSARLHQPVHLGSLSGRILPMPRLDLGEIYIGDAKQFQAVDAQINFDLMGLFIDAKPISSVDFHGVKVRGPWVRDVGGWLQQLASQDQYPVSQITISQGALDADAFQLNAMEANLNFDPAGKFTRGTVHAEGGKYTMDLVAEPGNRFETIITVHGSAMPLLPNWTFDELVAKGELTKDQLVVKNFDAKILGGSVQGNAILDWRSGWSAQGALNAKAIVMQNFSKLLDGKFDGAARFRMTAANLAGFADSASLDGSFKSGDGLLSGMDIVDTARMHSKENLPGGRTRYDQLVGNISYSDGAYHFSQVKINADVMETTATFDIDKQQLSGKMNVKLSLHDTMAPVSLQIGGTTDSPALVFAR